MSSQCQKKNVPGKGCGNFVNFSKNPGQRRLFHLSRACPSKLSAVCRPDFLSGVSVYRLQDRSAFRRLPAVITVRRGYPRSSGRGGSVNSVTVPSAKVSLTFRLPGSAPASTPAIFPVSSVSGSSTVTILTSAPEIVFRSVGTALYCPWSSPVAINPCSSGVV